MKTSARSWALCPTERVRQGWPNDKRQQEPTSPRAARQRRRRWSGAGARVIGSSRYCFGGQAGNDGRRLGSSLKKQTAPEGASELGDTIFGAPAGSPAGTGQRVARRCQLTLLASDAGAVGGCDSNIPQKSLGGNRLLSLVRQMKFRQRRPETVSSRPASRIPASAMCRSDGTSRMRSLATGH